MENITKYIDKVEQYVNNNPGITEDELIRYVYLDLGKRLSFNILFAPFGNRKKRLELYKDGWNLNKVDKCLEENVITCNAVSKILKIVLGHFGVDIEVEISNELVSFPHVYNIIKPKDGSEEYTIDLQEDMYHIQMNGRTPNYGIGMTSGDRVVPYFEQEQIDKKLGYISDDNYYTDDFLYTLKMDVSYMDNIYDKLKFILENIEVYENSNMWYADRQWYHVKILEHFFNPKEFNYQNGTGKIRAINCYKDREDNERIYVNCFVLEDRGETHIFLYNKKRCGYVEIDIDDFVQEINRGLVVHNQKIGEVQKRLRKIGNSEN